MTTFKQVRRRHSEVTLPDGRRICWKNLVPNVRLSTVDKLVFIDGSWIKIDEDGRLHAHLKKASRVHRRIIAYSAINPELPERPELVVLHIQDDEATLVVHEDSHSELNFPGFNGNSWV